MWIQWVSYFSSGGRHTATLVWCRSSWTWVRRNWLFVPDPTRTQVIQDSPIFSDTFLFCIPSLTYFMSFVFILAKYNKSGHFNFSFLLTASWVVLLKYFGANCFLLLYCPVIGQNQTISYLTHKEVTVISAAEHKWNSLQVCVLWNYEKDSLLSVQRSMGNIAPI